MLSLKPALKDSNMIEFRAGFFPDDPYRFNCYSTLIDYRIRFLQICDSARGYKFQIYFFSDANVITNIIASILQMPQIERCSTVELEIILRWGVQMQLPVKAILNWLENPADEMQINERKPKEKFLTIWLRGDHIHNVQELINHLKMV